MRPRWDNRPLSEPRYATRSSEVTDRVGMDVHTEAGYQRH